MIRAVDQRDINVGARQTPRSGDAVEAAADDQNLFVHAPPILVVTSASSAGRAANSMQSPPVGRILFGAHAVKRTRRDDHSSRPALARRLKPPTRGLTEQDRRPPIWCCSA